MNLRQHFKRLRVAFAVFLPLALLPGCTSTEPEVPVQTHYTLEVEPGTIQASPLPDAYNIYVNRHFSDGSVKRHEGFRGWDFDDDGRFEMVQVLNGSKEVTATVFDFDGDGTLDYKTEANAKLLPTEVKNSDQVKVVVPMSTGASGSSDKGAGDK